MSSFPNLVSEVKEPEERCYMSLSDSTSTESSTISNISDDNNYGLNLNAIELSSILKATELRLGIPGSWSQVRDPKHCQHIITKLDEKPLFPLMDTNFSLSQKTALSGHKRGFSVAMIQFSKRKYANSEVSAIQSIGNTTELSLKSVSEKIDHWAPSAKKKELVLQHASQDQIYGANQNGENLVSPSNNSNGAPPTKALVMGWPPIRSFRKNTLATTRKNTNEEEEEKAKKSSTLYVKVSMDGAPYLRKVDLRAYSAFQDLSLGLKKMFTCFTIGQNGSQSHGTASKEIAIETKLEEQLQYRCEYVLTYEDRDGDSMLLGDVPWEMFVDTCKRLRIMKGPDAIGLGASSTPME